MLKELKVRNLKSIEDLEISFKPLNLFIGTNSAGKSTVIQALLLCAQNAKKECGLNGELIKLGDYREVKCSYSDYQETEIVLNHSAEQYANLIFISNEPEIHFHGDALLRSLDYTNMNFQYLSGQRVGPQKIYDKNMSLNDQLGIDGRYAISYLQTNGDKSVSETLCKNNASSTLLSQVNWWLKYIMDTEISTQEVTGADKVLAFYSCGELNDLRPDNVGAGISYLVSVLVECLASPENGIVAIENPEIHLHPAAQSKLCEFLYFIAQSGRQLFIETHSDHIFNGFRAGIATGDMDKNNIQINFLYMNEEHLTENEVVDIGRMGRIENPRKDMFDQFDLDLNRMIGLRRTKS